MIVHGMGSERHIASPDPSNAPPYDQWRRAIPGTGAYRLVVAAVDATSDLRRRTNTRDGSRKRKRKAADQRMYEAQAHAVVSALVHRELVLSGGWTRIPLAHQRTGLRGQLGSQRYRSPAMSRSLPPFVHALARLGWMELRPGQLSGKVRVPSVMRASPWLVQQVARLGCNLEDFAPDPEKELIVLKGRRPEGHDGHGRPLAAQWLDYVDTSETDRMRSELRELNTWLASAAIDYVKSSAGVDPIGGRMLWRVFNNGSFEEGGRLAGGFWAHMTMSQKKAQASGRLWRGHIRIEGEPIVAVDFVSMFMRLLYVKAGVQPPHGDLLAGVDGLGPEYREGGKRVVYALLFKDRGLDRLPRHTRVLLPKGIHARTLEENIKRRHEPVAHLLGTGIGMKLFRLESDIILEVLRQCREQGIVALPVHDAILVAESRAEDAKRVMLAAFEAVTGFRGEVGDPKRPAAGAAELETTPMPDEVRNLEDAAELARVERNMREGHLKVAAEQAREFLERLPPPAPDTPEAEGDWI